MPSPKTATPPPSGPRTWPLLNRLEAELGLFESVSSQMAECDGLEPALEVLLRGICEAASWPLGRVWMPHVRDGDERLELARPCYCSNRSAERFHAESENIGFAPGEGLVGRTWTEKAPLWITSTEADTASRGHPLAGKFGFEAAVALPIIARGQVFAVAEFLMELRRPHDLQFAEIAERVTSHVGGLLLRIVAESALRESEQRFASFMQHLPAAALIRDADGRYLFVNSFVERITGRALKDWIGKTDAEIYTPGVQDIQKTDRIVLERRRPLVRVLQTLGPKPRHWMITKFPLLTDSQSRPLIGNISLEITEQKRAEESAREAAEKLRLLVDSVRDYAIYTLDTEGKVTTWGHGAVRLKGYTAEEIIGRNFSLFFTPEDQAAGKPARILAAAESEGRVESEGWRVRKDGSKFWASAILSSIRNDAGQLLGFAKVTRDLTEHKRAEDNRVLLAQTAEALRVRDEILSFASHEMRTPLASLQLQLQLLRRDKNALSMPNQKVLDRIDRAYVRMVELVESFLQYSRLQGGIIVQPELVDVRALTADVTDELRPQAQRNGLNVVLSKAGESPCIETDERFLRMILSNLIGNAIKFSQSGDIEVTIEARDGEQRISVRDHGSGIPPGDQIRIFEPFQRGESIANKHISGVGLGLALVKRMCEAIGARIELESQVGVGSTFTLIFRGAESHAEKS